MKYRGTTFTARRAREVLDAKGLTLEQIIDFYLLPLLEASETKFFPWRKVTKRKTEQIIDEKEVAALGTRCFADDVLFRLRGDYAPKKLGLDPDEGGPVNIYLGGIPRHKCPGIYDLSGRPVRMWKLG